MAYAGQHCCCPDFATQGESDSDHEQLFDAVAAISDTESMDSAADTCIGAGSAGTILADLTGLTDWQDGRSSGAARRVSSRLAQSECGGIDGGSLLMRRHESVTVEQVWASSDS